MELKTFELTLLGNIMFSKRSYHTWYSRASKPLNTNSNMVFRFSGLGAVTKILEYLKGSTFSGLLVCVIKNTYTFQQQSNIKINTYPKATALAIARPSAADLPRPLAAVITTVLRNVFSDIASINFSNALPCKVK